MRQTKPNKVQVNPLTTIQRTPVMLTLTSTYLKIYMQQEGGNSFKKRKKLLLKPFISNFCRHLRG
jgi:hypothetical protein